MSIILKNGAVFLHIPKTGGNWITEILTELNLIKEHRAGRKHADINHFFSPPVRGRRATMKDAAHRVPYSPKNKPFMFCFVRNPLSWYESYFKYMEQPSRQWRFWGDEQNIYKWHPNSLLNGLGNCNFNEFVRNVNTKRPGYVSEMYGWYNSPQIDFVGKQECLVDDFIKVLRIMNVDFDEAFIRNYGKVGVSPKTKKDIIWQNDLKIETALYEYSGMMRYGYQSTLKELGIDTDHLTKCSTLASDLDLLAPRQKGI